MNSLNISFPNRLLEITGMYPVSRALAAFSGLCGALSPLNLEYILAVQEASETPDSTLPEREEQAQKKLERTRAIMLRSISQTAESNV